MNVQRAIEIVTPLADGVHPFTGESFGDGDLYQNADVARALWAAVTALEDSAERERKRRSLPPNAGQPWAKDEDARLLDGFEAGRPLSQLAKEHGRTRAAIEARLVMYDKLEQRTFSTGSTS